MVSAPTAPRSRPRRAIAGAACGVSGTLQPNEFDQRRIVHALESRERYRYVMPRVEMVEDGYCVVSPCCSRRIDPDGGEIEIAYLEFIRRSGWWRLHSREHTEQRWVVYAEFARLSELLAHLNRDPGRIFWP